jgi:pimeloyl-ACP methyl ester carboxylesterase
MPNYLGGLAVGLLGVGLNPESYRGAIVRENQRGKPLPANRWASATIPALVMDGGNSPAWMLHANRAFASVLPNAQYRTLKGQTHMLKPKAHAPVLVEFFKD